MNKQKCDICGKEYLYLASHRAMKHFRSKAKLTAFNGLLVGRIDIDDSRPYIDLSYQDKLKVMAHDCAGNAYPSNEPASKKAHFVRHHLEGRTWVYELESIG